MECFNLRGTATQNKIRKVHHEGRQNEHYLTNLVPNTNIKVKLWKLMKSVFCAKDFLDKD